VSGAEPRLGGVEPKLMDATLGDDAAAWRQLGGVAPALATTGAAGEGTRRKQLVWGVGASRGKTGKHRFG
jgi:hypothetical protein